MKIQANLYAEREISAHTRFAFSANWRSYLDTIDEARISGAVSALKKLCGGLETNLVGKTFLDAGCGSGLMSLAAHRLGMKVVSFDFDPAAVPTTCQLKELYAAKDYSWFILQGSLLDERFMEEPGTFDIVYSWGVCHHTGSMYKALEQVSKRAAGGGHGCNEFVFKKY